MLHRVANIALSGLCLLLFYGASGQRTYAPHSVLSAGESYRLSVTAPGIYKIDLALLSSMGVPTGNLSSSSIRLFGNGGGMLPESNNGPYTDDLTENAIRIVDGGDGVINGSDYILFYAQGPDQWINDPANQRFSHRKNLFSDKAYYYLTIGSNGRRVATAAPGGSFSSTITSFSERYFHELDSVNFLSSGKEWYGEEFSNAPGHTPNRSFDIPVTGLINGSTLSVQLNTVARSVGVPSRFDIQLNGQPAGQLPVNGVSGGTYDLFAQQGSITVNGIAGSGNPNLTINYIPGSFNAQGWLNWFELFGRRALNMSGADQLLFRDWSSVGNAGGQFIVAGATANTQVWDVTDPLNPVQVSGAFANNEYRFIADVSRLREYIAFNNSGYLIPAAAGKVAVQDLHNSIPADLLIITTDVLKAQAERLANFHRQRDGLRVWVVTTAQIFHEFASGIPDPTALRNWVKMYYDRYHTVPADKPRYLLLFGDASFDYRDRLKNNTNQVPAYENNFSADPLSTYASDDFFGFLDDQEDINSGLIVNDLDIGIGRVPAGDEQAAKNFVDKVLKYYSAAAMGPWRNNITFVADDEDQNLHLQDAELISAGAAATDPVLNQEKIYLDAYQQESGSGGSRYPKVNQAISNGILTGTLIWNFNGHGGANRLAEETVLDQESVSSWKNSGRLPLFITATCDFAPYDNPLVRSIGEDLLLRSGTGAIALMTTTRVVFAFSNRIMNNNYLRSALQPDANGKYKSLGDAVRDAKNITYQGSGDVSNNRKFTLLGDPAMTLAFPSLQVRTTKINGIAAGLPDTIRAAEKIVIEGEVTDRQGNLLTGYNGNIYPAVFDKPQQVTTLANDPGSQVTQFSLQQNLLFRGKASVVNGRYSFTFTVPRDINYQYGNGRLSLYAEDGTLDGSGFYTGFVVGGTGTGATNDNAGPHIKAWLNDEKFVNGGIVDPNPVLLVRLADSSGINTTGTGIGHDLVATLDNDPKQYFILNDFYEADLNSYQQGLVRFQLPELTPGLHSLKIKAWDVLNNSGEISIDFMVAADEKLVIAHVLNYPNPFTTHTNFWFEHNKPGQDLRVEVQVFAVSGKLIKSIRETINTPGNRSDTVEWNGRDEYGNKPGRGVYIYRISIRSADGQKAEKTEKLVIF